MFRNIKSHYGALKDLMGLLTRHRQLTIEMAKRDITDRYRGQFLGVFWAFGHPLTLMAVYTFVFVVVFKIKIGGTVAMPLDYTTYLLSGLIPWMSFQESMSKGSVAITSNANLVKQVVFPIEILPIKGAIASMFTMVIYFIILIIYVLFSHHGLLWTYCLLPLVILIQTVTMIGISYVLSAVGAYFRDMKDFVQVFCVAGVYLIPVVYLPESVPQLFRPLLYLNPFSYYMWVYQDTLYFGRFMHWWAWIFVSVVSCVLFYFGYRIFKKLKVMFGSVL
ncbi:MAG: ABC transporter permease [Bacillota bacterium]|nr:ABC transporter permease [Bacillota bacterium]